MKVICIDDVIVNGFVVYSKGYEYEVEKLDNGSFNMVGNYGVGSFDKNDSIFTMHFVEIKNKQVEENLKYLEKELSKKTQQFQSVNFHIDKKKRLVIFAGNKDDRTFIGLSQCRETDKFELVIGKLIAIKRALREDVGDVIKLVEENQ